MAQICENWKTKFDLIKPKYNELWTASNLTGQTHLNPRFVHQKKKNFKPIWIPPKSPKFEPVWPEMSQTLAQILKNQTSNPSEPRFAYQNLTTNPPELSKNPEFQTQELGSTQH